MTTSAFRLTRSRTAIACSIALHCCVLLLASITWHTPTLFRLADANEADPALPIRLEVRPRVHPAQPRFTPAPHVAVAARRETHVIASISRPRVPASHAHALPAVAAASAADLDRIAHQRLPTAASARTAMVTSTAATGTQTSLQSDPAPPATSPPTPAPTPSATATVASRGDGGLFGQNYPALPNPRNAFEAIRARIVGHFRIRVHVDETGHATAVDFITPIGDASLADEVRTTLLALSYVPADCDGLRCADDVEITR